MLKDVRRLSCLLTIIATLLYAYSLIQAKYEIGYYGSIHSLPFVFFVALSLLMVASALLWVSPRPHGELLGIQLAFFVVALHLTPLALGGIGAAQTGAQALYSEFGLSEFIFRTGHISPFPVELWRLNWPGAIALNAIIMLLLDNSDASFILTLNIFIWVPLITALVYLLMKNIIDNVNYRMAATWVFFLGSWVLYYLMPSVLGYLLLLVVLGLLAKAILQGQKRHSFSGTVICILLLLLVFPAVHLLTAITSFCIILALYFISNINIFGISEASLANRTNILIFGIYSVAIILAWTFIANWDFLQWRLSFFLAQIFEAFRPDVLWKIGVTERMVGGASHLAVNNLRVLSAVLFCVIGLVGGVMTFKQKKITSSDEFVIAMIIGIIGVSIIISVAYKWEMIQRAYIFMVPAIAYFSVKMLRHRVTAIILSVLMIAAVPLHYVSQYGNALVDYVSPAEIRGVYFFHDHTEQGFLTGSLVHFPIGTMVHRENYYWVFVEQIRIEDNVLKHPIGYPEYTYHYVYLRPDDQAIYEFLGAGDDEHINEYSKYMLGEVTRQMDSVTNFNLVYINRDISLYTGISTLYQDDKSTSN